APFTKAFQGNSFNADSFNKLFDPIGYKSVLDKIFGFDASGQMQDFFKQSAKMMENFHQSTQQSGSKFYEMMQKEGNLFTGLLPVDQAAFVEMYKNYYGNLRNSYAPFFKLTAAGKDKEQME